jgi:ergothioneine biosynthesis protein EgtB
MPAAIDHSDMRGAGPGPLSLALMDARNHTLHLLNVFEQGLPRLAVPRQPGLEPPVWLAGHIAWLAEYWIGRNPQRHLGLLCPADTVRLASIAAHADAWFDPALASPDQRWSLELPDPAALRAYLLETLESTLELLDKAPPDDPGLYFFRMALFHEDLRGEQFLAMAQTLGLPFKLPVAASPAPREPLLIPAGRWMLGAQPGGFVFDVEKWAHEVNVPEFEIDAQPVNWSQYVEFAADGGYDDPQWWLPEGWAWLQAHAGAGGRRAPRHVDQIGAASGAVMQTLFGRPTRRAGEQAVLHVSWWEADAWCRWAGRRLPTEVEWEMAAHVAGRRGFQWGDVHEWTASPLRPWLGFAPDAWTRHTDLEATALFGRARVLRGASFATRARLKNPKARGFALPDRDDLFVGFRSCAV